MSEFGPTEGEPQNAREIEIEQLSQKIADGYYQEEANPFELFSPEDRLELACQIVRKNGVGNMMPKHFGVFEKLEEQERIEAEFISQGRAFQMFGFIERGVFSKLNQNMLVAAAIYEGHGSRMSASIEKGNFKVDTTEMTKIFEKKFGGNGRIAKVYFELINTSVFGRLQESYKLKREEKEEFNVKLGSFIKTCGLDPKETLSFWASNCALYGLKVEDPRSNPVGNFEANLDAMAFIEARRTGGIKRLNEEFGIVNFGRYDPGMLDRQLKNSSDTHSPYGVIIFPRSDHNGAFGERSGLFLELEKNLAKHGYLPRIIETGRKTYLYKRVMGLNQRYNQSGENRIKFVILGGHGSCYSINLGDREFGYQSYTQDRKISQPDFFMLDHPEKQKSGFEKKAKAYERFKKCFDTGIDIILHSCSTAKEKEGEHNIAGVISKSMGATTTGPQEPAGATNLFVEVDDKGRLHLRQLYSSEKGIYQQGKRKEES